MGQQLSDFFTTPSSTVPPGVTPGFIFSKDGTATVGTYLRIGAVISSNSGHPIIGKNKLVSMRITSETNVASNTVVQLQKRTAVNTRTDISGATITILAGNYKGDVTFSTPISLDENVELCAYNKSGSTLNNCVLNVFLYPDYT